MSIYDFSQDVRGGGRRRALLVDEDFSWSEVPSRRRGASTAVAEREFLPLEQAVSTAVPYPADSHGIVDEYVYEDDYYPDDREAMYVSEDLRDDEVVDADEVFLDEESGAIELAGPGRRTIVITGRGTDERALATRSYRGAGVQAHARSGFKPDRVALWAFLLALALILGATTSSHAAVLAHHIAH